MNTAEDGEVDIDLATEEEEHEQGEEQHFLVDDD